MTNSYLLKGFKGENRWWRYLVMFIILIIATLFGSFPYAIAISIKSEMSGIQVDPGSFNAFAQLGLSKNLGLFLLTLSFVAGLVAFLIFLKPLHERSFKDTLTGRNKFDFKRFFFAVFVWGGLLIISLIISYLINPQDYEMQFNFTQFIILIFISVVFISMQASFEEIIFRGYMQQGLANLTKTAWFPLIFTSVLFGLMHISNPEVKEFGVGIMLPQYIVLGLLLGITVIMDEGLEIAIGVHVVNNVLSSLLVTHESSVLQTDALLRVKTIDPVYSFYEIILFSAIFILIANKKYKWGSFRKLFAKVKPELTE